MAEKSDNGIFLLMTYQAMSRAGLDCAAIFASVGMPDEPPDQQLRRKNSPQHQFWSAAEKISGDPDIGLRIGDLMPPFRGQVVEYLFLSSPTFGDGLERCIRYHRLLTDALQFSLRMEDDVAVLAGLEHPVRHYLECATSVVLRFLRHVSEGHFQPREIWFTHQDGAVAETYERVYQCPVRLGMPEGVIRFEPDVLSRSSLTAEPELLAIHEDLANAKMADLSRRDFFFRMENELGNLLERGTVSLDTLAQQMGMSPRSLRSELSKAGTSYKAVLAGFREKLARRLLARTQEPIDQIIYLTGFSEPAAFSRAFKRWTGETPTAYRSRKQQQNPDI